MAEQEKEQGKNQKKGFFGRLFDKLDKKMEAEAKSRPCCSKSSDGKGKSCCS